MAYNVLYYNSSDGAITQFNSADLAQLSEYVLEIMAANTYAGTITVDNTNPIGTFTDTVRVGAVDSEDITVLSNTYTLSQVNTVQSTVDPPMYLGLQANSTSVVIQENITTLDDLADEVIKSLVSDYGVNSYYLGVSPPGDGGTWVSRGSLKDTLENFTVTNSNYRLWHKVIGSTYTSYKAPLKLGPSSEILSWTSTEVERLIKKVEERIVATGIGSYALQTSVPEIGTWTSVGTISDVRRVANIDPTFIGTESYSSSYEGPAFGGYTDSDGQSFTVSYETTYSGPVGYTGTGSFTGNISYVGPAIYTGVTPAPSYLGPGTFTGVVGYTGQPAYTFPMTYVGGYTGIGSDFYTGTTGNFLVFGSTYQGPLYTTPIPFTGGTATFSGFYVAEYFAPQPGFYTGPSGFEGFLVSYSGFASFLGSAVVYSGDVLYTGDDVTSFTGDPVPATFASTASYAGTGSFTGPAIFTNPNASAFSISYVGDSYAGPVTYTGTTSGSYEGPSYDNENTQYTGPSVVTGTTETISTVTLWKRVA